jgi:citrate synthase
MFGRSASRALLQSQPRLVAALTSRNFSSGCGLKERFAELYPARAEIIKQIKKDHGSMVLGTCTIEQAYGGMRSVKSMVTETSVLDAEEGIRFRGLTIPECQQQLPAAKGGQEPLPESLFWLLVTGEVPTDSQVAALTAEWHDRGDVPQWVEQLIASTCRHFFHISYLSNVCKYTCSR